MRKIFFGTVLLLTMGAQVAFGCSLRNMQLQQVPPDITVVVTHQGKPIAGIAVEVTSTSDNKERVFTGIADERGTVLVKGLPAGQYYLTAAHRELEAGREWIEVIAAPDAKARKRFDFEWADWSYPTQRVAGTLTGLVPGNTGNKLQDLIHPKQTVYSGVAITLMNAFSDAQYPTVSDSTGFFIFDHVPDGIYILAIDGGMMSVAGRPADPTTLVLDLMQDSSRDSLPLQLKQTGCYGVEFELTEK